MPTSPPVQPHALTSPRPNPASPCSTCSRCASSAATPTTPAGGAGSAWGMVTAWLACMQRWRQRAPLHQRSTQLGLEPSNNTSGMIQPRPCPQQQLRACTSQTPLPLHQTPVNRTPEQSTHTHLHHAHARCVLGQVQVRGPHAGVPGGGGHRGGGLPGGRAHLPGQPQGRRPPAVRARARALRHQHSHPHLRGGAQFVGFLSDGSKQAEACDPACTALPGLGARWPDVQAVPLLWEVTRDWGRGGQRGRGRVGRAGSASERLWSAGSGSGSAEEVLWAVVDQWSAGGLGGHVPVMMVEGLLHA